MKHPSTPSGVLLKGLAILNVTAFCTLPLSAGPLASAYEKFKGDHAGLQAQDYIIKAAEQDIITEKRGYMPAVVAEARQLAIGQRIKQDGTGIFQSGRDNYGSQRAIIEIDQPIIDLKVKHKIAGAEAKKRIQSGLFQSKESEITRRFVQTFTDAVRYAQLVRSLDRVVSRLERELNNVSQSLDKQMATVEDLENTKSALVAMRREKLLFQQEHDRSLAELGLDSSATANLVITSSNQLTLPTPVGYPQLPNHEADVLQAEIDAFESLAAATRSEDMPRLSLYGLLQHDDAGGSEFGGARTLNGYEAGLVLRWDIWDGGANRSKAKKIEFLKMAKEAELKTQRLRASRGTGLAANSLKLSKANLQSLDELVEHQASILKVIETSYKEGGEASYMKMVNAFLIYESQVRQQVHGRFDHINKQTDLYASHAGWTPGLIEGLDRMFTSSR